MLYDKILTEYLSDKMAINGYGYTKKPFLTPLLYMGRWVSKRDHLGKKIRYRAA